MVYNRHSWKVMAIVLTEGRGRVWDLERLVARSSEAQSGCPVTYTYTRRTARELFAAAGYRVDSIQVEHIFPYRVADYVDYRYVRQWQFRYLPPAVFAALEHILGWHLCITASGA
jgi:hypothetical protein